jgi:uncharacterized protein YuzE
MIVHLGSHAFDDVLFDAERDVLYMHKGEPTPAHETMPSPEGHAIMFDELGEIVGITVVNARWLAERDGQITVTVPESAHAPERLETSAKDLARALAA